MGHILNSDPDNCFDRLPSEEGQDRQVAEAMVRNQRALPHLLQGTWNRTMVVLKFDQCVCSLPFSPMADRWRLVGRGCWLLVQLAASSCSSAFFCNGNNAVAFGVGKIR